MRTTTLRKRALPAAVMTLMFVAGCSDSSSPQAALPTVKMQLGQKTFELEVANATESRERGLMRRDSMPEDHGMIFVFAREQPLGFWMKDTRIPLDIIYVDGGGKVVSVKQMKPYDRTEVRSDYPAKWAIELNKDAASGAAVKVGDVLSIPPAAQNAQ